MCTSFVYRRSDVIVGMNFDNNGMRFSVDTGVPGQFVVYVDGGKGLSPSFGINRHGTFFNSTTVDSNGKGTYRRAGKTVTHTARLVSDILAGTIAAEDLGDYLGRTEVVNTPASSIHNMLCDSGGNVWVVEPGRGVLASPAAESPFFVLSNCSVCDYRASGVLEGSGADRYRAVHQRLTGADDFGIDAAFDLLAAVAQKGEWTTALSLVYVKSEQTVFYCLNGDPTRHRQQIFAA